MATKRWMEPFLFDGVVEVADDDTEQLVLVNDSFNERHVKGVQVHGASVGLGSGTTTIDVATVPHDGVGGSRLQIDVDAAASTATPVSGDITWAAGGSLYIYPTAAGGHMNLRGAIEVEE